MTHTSFEHEISTFHWARYNKAGVLGLEASILPLCIENDPNAWGLKHQEQQNGQLSAQSIY